MNNEIITYILHFEVPNNCLSKDNIYFNNNYCEIIKKENTSEVSNILNKVSRQICISGPAASSTLSSLSLFNAFTQSFENRIVNCIKNNIYDFFTKPKNMYDDIIRL
jgi:hypothetical protein